MLDLFYWLLAKTEKKWYFYVTDFSSCVRPVGLIDDRNGKICLIQSQYHLYIAFMDCRVRTTTGVLMVMMSWNHTDSVYMALLKGNNISFFFFQVRTVWLNYFFFVLIYTSWKDKYWFSRWVKRKNSNWFHKIAYILG